MSPLYPSTLGPGNLPPGAPQLSRSRRDASGAFQLFQAPQIQQFKEAFSLIDQDGDGIVSEKDLKVVFANLGLTPTSAMLDSLLSARPGGHFRNLSPPAGSTDDSVPDKGVNFAMFLTMMGERLFEFDSEAELLEAFECFDENNTGMVRVEEMRKWFAEVGDRMNEDEINRLLKGPFTDRQGNFKYREWVKAVRVNEDDEDGDARS